MYVYACMCMHVFACVCVCAKLSDQKSLKGGEYDIGWAYDQDYDDDQCFTATSVQMVGSKWVK